MVAAENPIELNMEKNYIFISGCPRTGTTALVKLLNTHPDVIIGMERYKAYAFDPALVSNLKPSLFTAESFFDMRPDQTNVLSGHLEWEREYKSMYDELKVKWELAVERGNADSIVWGDKFPQYCRLYKQMDDSFDDHIKWIFTTRNIMEVALSFNYRAESVNSNGAWSRNWDYKMAVTLWNESLKETWRYLRMRPWKMMVVDHSSIFSENQECLDILVDFLGLKVDEGLRRKHMKMTTEWRSNFKKRLPIIEQEKYILANADIDLYNSICKGEYLYR